VETPLELRDLSIRIEEAIRRRIAIGTKITHAKLQEDLLKQFQNARAIDYVRI
jgi:hypothetical protein